MRVLVVGGTGILAPAAAVLFGAGETVTVLGRGGRAAPKGTELLTADAGDPDALDAALRDGEWERALVYAGAAPDASVAVIRDRVRGRCVLVRTSAAVDPALGDPDIPGDVLQLGWTPDVPPRWHTPEEVSRAALLVLVDGVPRTLGVIRPWSDRPGASGPV